MLLALGACGGNSSTDTGSENVTDTSAKTENGDDFDKDDENADTDTTSDSGQNSESDSESNEVVDSESESSEESDDTRDSSEDEASTNTNTDSAADSDTETDTETDTGIEDLGPAPIDQELTIISEGASEYIIVYERRNEKLMEYATALSKHIEDTYGVSISCYEFGRAPSSKTKRIVIGEADVNAKFAKAQVYSAGDFIVDVCGDDLMLYASTEYMYNYLFDIAKEEIFAGENKESLIFEADSSYIFHDSEYKDINYAEYLKQKNGNYTKDTILNIFEARTDATIPYRIYVPSSYDPDKEYPVLTILHGAGERGNNNQAQLINLVPNLFNQENSKYMDAIIICPQCPSGQQWVDTPWADGNYSIDDVPISNELEAVLEIISSVRTELSTDTSRYYAMGLSMGGFGAWDLIMRNPTMFAGAVCLCGGADPSQAENLVDMPIWTVHSSNDSSVPYAGTEEMCQAIENAGGELCIFETKSSGHNVWGYAGDSVEIAEWLFEKKRSNNG